jgi:hypothetical protein
VNISTHIVEDADDVTQTDEDEPMSEDVAFVAQDEFESVSNDESDERLIWYDWLVDSGTTSHITKIRSAMTKFVPLKSRRIHCVHGDLILIPIIFLAVFMTWCTSFYWLDWRGLVSAHCAFKIFYSQSLQTAVSSSMSYPFSEVDFDANGNFVAGGLGGPGYFTRLLNGSEGAVSCSRCTVSCPT